ncbi:MAG TPA: EndoU domain-containing protein, partial [Cyclobacteriaceae bacterium]
VGDKDAKVIVVPALMLQYAQDKKFNTNAAAGFFMTLDAVTILVPMTKVYNLAKITQRIYLGLDLAAAAGSLGNLTVNMLNNDPAFAGVVAKYNLVTAVVNIAALAGGTKLAANLAGEFVGEVNKPGVKEALQQLAVKGNKNADEILALERELQLEGKVAGQNWVTSIAQNTAANIDITDDAITLGADLLRAKSYLAKTSPPAGTIDVVVHGSGDEYILLVNGVEKTFDHRALATWLSKNGYDKNTIRLLSCSSLESAQDLANKLNQKVIAVEDAVRVFEDGGIASVGNKQWYELTPGNGTRQAAVKPRAPANLEESFVELGSGVKQVKIVQELTRTARDHIRFGEVKITVKNSNTGEIISTYVRRPQDLPVNVPKSGVSISVDVSGIHFESTLKQGLIEELPGTRSLLLKLSTGEQVFKSKIKVFVQEGNNGSGIWKSISSDKTWWPSSWSEQTVWGKISEAFSNKKNISGTKWHGTTVAGEKIEMYLDSQGNIMSAYIIP